MKFQEQPQPVSFLSIGERGDLNKTNNCTNITSILQIVTFLCITPIEIIQLMLKKWCLPEQCLLLIMIFNFVQIDDMTTLAMVVVDQIWLMWGSMG